MKTLLVFATLVISAGLAQADSMGRANWPNMDKAISGWGKSANFDRHSANDVILALRKEFADELSRLMPYANVSEKSLGNRAVYSSKLMITPSVRKSQSKMEVLKN